MRKIAVIFIVHLLLSVTIVKVSSTSFEEPEFEWKVNVGDTMTYIYTEYFNIYDTDENGDPYSLEFTIMNTEGENVNVSLQKGLIVKAEIIELNGYANVQLSLNGIITPTNSFTGMFYGFIVKETVDNKTYWKNQTTHTIESTIFENITLSTYLEGSNFVNSYLTTSTSVIRSSSTVRKFNWKTGWFTYFHLQSWNETHLIQELELSTETKGIFSDLDLSRVIIPALFLLSVLIIVVLSKRKAK